MSDNKKYYYLKLADNFYDRDEMIMLESMQDGYMYSNILLKLYLRSLKNEGKLLFNDRIPYNAQMLASITRHSVGVVEKALKIFLELGLIEILDNGAIYMLDIQNFIGKSSTEGDRKREYRKRIDKDKQTNRHLSGHLSDIQPPELELELELEKDIEIDIEKDIDIDIDKSVSKSANKKISIMSKLYQENIGVINGLVAEWLLEIGNTIELDLFKRALEICTERGNLNLGYLKGILKRWSDKNINTLAQLKAYELQRKNIINETGNPISKHNIRDESDDPEFQKILEESNKLLEEFNKKWGE